MCTSFWPDASIGSLTCYVLRAINSFTFCSELFPKRHPDLRSCDEQCQKNAVSDNLHTFPIVFGKSLESLDDNWYHG